MRNLFEWVFVVLIAVGVALVYVPAGVITLGVLGLLWVVFGLDEGGDDGAQ